VLLLQALHGARPARDARGVHSPPANPGATLAATILDSSGAAGALVVVAIRLVLLDDAADVAPAAAPVRRERRREQRAARALVVVLVVAGGEQQRAGLGELWAHLAKVAGVHEDVADLGGGEA
jgi:hypothetical protein